MEKFKKSIARLLIGGVPAGTAWVVTSNMALTAWHCIAVRDENDEPTGEYHPNITIHFRDSKAPLIATYVAHDCYLDSALLQFEDPRLEPLLGVGLPPPEHSAVSMWKSHGFPSAVHEMRNGKTLRGHIDDYRADRNGSPAIDLFCTNAVNVPNFGETILGGVSGAPVIAEDQNDRVIGMILYAPEALAEKTILASPVSEIISRFSDFLSSDLVEPWRARRPSNGHSIEIVKTAAGWSWSGSVQPRDVAILWVDGIADIACNFHLSDANTLACALLRIAVHTAPSNCRWHVSAVNQWRRYCGETTKNSIPLDGAEAVKRFQAMNWQTYAPLKAATSNSSWDSEDSSGEIANLIHQALNRDLLDKLADCLERLLGEHEWGLIGYKIESNLRHAMRDLWKEWNAELESSADLLQHFFSLMLTHDGDSNRVEGLVGAGPATLHNCILPSVVLALVINIAFHKPMPLRPEPPGHFGTDSLAGHACGIQVLGGLKLSRAINSELFWKTKIVLLPNLECPIDVCLAASRSLSEPTITIPRLDRAISKPFTVPLEPALTHAIEGGLIQLREFLRVKLNQLKSEHEDQIHAWIL